jgi:hypothetical protein
MGTIIVNKPNIAIAKKLGEIYAMTHELGYEAIDAMTMAGVNEPEWRILQGHFESAYQAVLREGDAQTEVMTNGHAEGGMAEEADDPEDFASDVVSASAPDPGPNWSPLCNVDRNAEMTRRYEDADWTFRQLSAHYGLSEARCRQIVRRHQRRVKRFNDAQTSDVSEAGEANNAMAR